MRNDHIALLKEQTIDISFALANLKETENTSKYVNHLKAKATILNCVLAYSRGRMHLTRYGKRYLGRDKLIHLTSYKDVPGFISDLLGQDQGFDIGYFFHLMDNELLTAIEAILAVDPIKFKEQNNLNFKLKQQNLEVDCQGVPLAVYETK